MNPTPADGNACAPKGATDGTAATPPAALEALRWFPLVPRPRPVRAPLEDRLKEIRTLIEGAATAADPDTPTAVAYNRAALIASDHHLPDLARDLCWQHHERYRAARTWTARQARLALEPLVNLARLHARAHQPDHAIDLLTDLQHGIDTRTDTVIDGRPVSTARITPDPDEHRAVRTWLWTVLLAEGTRALATTGRWTDALAHARRLNGIGHRLLDGRQVAIIAHLADGEHTAARHLLDHSDVREPWEHSIASTLACATDATIAGGSGPALPKRVTTMIQDYLALDLDERHRAFTERLGITVSALAHLAHQPDLADAVRPTTDPAVRLSLEGDRTVNLAKRGSSDAYSERSSIADQLRDAFALSHGAPH